MRKIILLISLCFSIGFCFAQTQMEMNDTAAANYQKTDKELNTVYQQVLKEYHADTAFIRNLKIAQRIWIQFRDAEMKLKYPDRENGYYGSVFPVCWYMYQTSLTNDRIKTLKIWLTGIEEGDVCSGSVKVKEN